MKHKTLAVAAVLALIVGLMAIPATSWDDSNVADGARAIVDQDANSNIEQNAGVFSEDWNPFADADQDANSNIQQNANVNAENNGFAEADQDANSNIEQNADVSANGGSAQATVDQEANSNIQQNANVRATGDDEAKDVKGKKERDVKERPEKEVEEEQDVAPVKKQPKQKRVCETHMHEKEHVHKKPHVHKERHVHKKPHIHEEEHIHKETHMHKKKGKKGKKYVEHVHEKPHMHEERHVHKKPHIHKERHVHEETHVHEKPHEHCRSVEKKPAKQVEEVEDELDRKGKQSYQPKKQVDQEQPRKDYRKGKMKGKYGNGKTTICHAPPGNAANAHTISVGGGAVQAHLGNHDGDTLGDCAANKGGYSKQKGKTYGHGYGR